MISSLAEISAVSNANLAMTNPFAVAAPGSSHNTALPVRTPPRAIPVAGVDRLIEVKIASEMDEWEQAFRLVANNYRARGYEPDDSTGLRFTPYHALPDTTTFIAKHADKVAATLTLVSDNHLLGLPMECIYGEEIAELRREGRRIVEVTSLADCDLSRREFVPVFVSLLRIMVQWGIGRDADTWVISINPRHRIFYRKMMGFVPLGPMRPHPSVENHPAEAYKLDVPLLQANAPRMYDEFFTKPLPDDALRARRLPGRLAHYFSICSSKADRQTIDDILRYVAKHGSPRLW